MDWLLDYRSDSLSVDVSDWKLVSFKVLNVDVDFLLEKKSGPLSKVRVLVVAD
jgi:hypothetical protein